MVHLNANYRVLWGFIGQCSVFFPQMDLKKIKIKHRHNYTDSALMG